MRKKFVFALFALMGLGTIVVLGSSPDFVGKVIGSLRQNAIPEIFSPLSRAKEIIKNERRSKKAPRQDEVQKVETPDKVLWQIVFDFTKKSQIKSEEMIQQKQDGTLYSEYFTRQGPLSADEDFHLKEIAGQYAAEVDPLDQRAKKIQDDLKAAKKSGLDEAYSSELKELQSKKDEAALRYRDELKKVFGDEKFGNFQTFLKAEFSKGSFVLEIDAPGGGGVRTIYYTPISKILWNDTRQQPLIGGYSQLYFEYDFVGYSFDPALDSYFDNVTTQSTLESGSSIGYQDIVPAQVFHSIYYSNRGNQYCVETDHFGLLFDYGTLVDVKYLPTTIDCHTVGPAPPTPTPTPTPSPTPPCEPLTGEALVPCQPTPTPTPTPTPSVTIVPIDVVEKYGERNFSVTVRNNDTGTTKFVLRTTAGTGMAKFENDTDLQVILGNAENHLLKVKGVTESSQIDNVRIEAKMNNDPAVKASDDFTVAVISSLVFEKFDSTYPELNDNPGTDGIVNPDQSEGRRIFPDALSGNAKAKSSVKVKATVLPAAANLKVYFGSFDLDDPSATGAPIDPTGADGNDNNGPSKAGTFSVVSGDPCTSDVPGTAPNYVSTVECTTGSDGTVRAIFKTTMQPGDNFAVGASVSSNYRDAMKVNASSGSQVINANNQPIYVSGQTNSNNVAGIRTLMLTVWRKLNIEVDSMGQARENYARENISGSSTIAFGHSKTLNLIAASLEVNRFQNGRMELAPITNVLDVTANTANSVTVMNSTSSNIVLANNVNFELSNGSNSAIGTIPTGQTIEPSQTVTLSVTGTPLISNLFSGGQLFITPALRSLVITSNTATSVTVTNNGPGSVAIADATRVRLYDDDDMDNQNPANAGSARNGDEGEDVPEPNMDLLQPNDTACIVDANGQITNSCNVLLPAYIRPADAFLSGSHENILFSANTPDANILGIYSAHFGNIASEASSNFWTVYLLGVYQWILSTNNSAEDWDADPDYNPATLSGNSFVFGKVDNLNGVGVTIFNELNRSTEQENINRFNSVANPTVGQWQNRPVGAKYTVAHELGHLFFGLHDLASGGIDPGLMAPSATRTVGTFSSTTINAMRGGLFTDHTGMLRRITHP